QPAPHAVASSSAGLPGRPRQLGSALPHQETELGAHSHVTQRPSITDSPNLAYFTLGEERHTDIRTRACGAVTMFRRVHVSTEFAFLVSGVFIMVVAWALNLMGVVSGDQSSGHGGGDVYLWLILMFQGLAFSTVGVVGANYREFTVHPAMGKRYLVGFLLIADGGVHLLALNQHIGNVAAAVFFEIVAPLQILGGIAFPYLERRLDLAWLLFTVFLLGAFVATRTMSIWPIGAVEELDPLGVLSKGVELSTAWVLVSLARAGSPRKATREPASHAHDP